MKYEICNHKLTRMLELIELDGNVSNTHTVRPIGIWEHLHSHCGSTLHALLKELANSMRRMLLSLLNHAWTSTLHVVHQHVAAAMCPNCNESISSIPVRNTKLPRASQEDESLGDARTWPPPGLPCTTCCCSCGRIPAQRC